MPDKTTEKITRTCFIWRPTKDVPSTRICTAWFEILRVGDGENQATSFNMLLNTRSAKKGGKFQKSTFLNVCVSQVLSQIQELGIKAADAHFEPVPIETPPECLDSFFELLAAMLEEKSIAPDQLTKSALIALAQAAYLEASTPKTPPKPPPILGLGQKKRL